MTQTTGLALAPRRFLCPLVGMHFHPPAKALLEALPSGAALWLERDPGNAYDPWAIKVLVEPWQIPESQHQELSLKVEGYGLSLEEVLRAEEWWLGFCASKPPKGFQPEWTLAPELAPLLDQAPGQATAKLSFAPAGTPLVWVEVGQ